MSGEARALATIAFCEATLAQERYPISMSAIFPERPYTMKNQVVIAALIFEYDTLNTTTQFQQNIRAITVWHIIASIGYFYSNKRARNSVMQTD